MKTRTMLLLLLPLLACKDHDQQAREVGEAARAEVARRCGADAGPDGGVAESPGAPTLAPDIPGLDSSFGAEACAHQACSSACAAYAETVTFHRACIAACVANTECATDADCSTGLRCVAIAPRVRRCSPGKRSSPPTPSP
jgi:hypothetical protein